MILLKKFEKSKHIRKLQAKYGILIDKKQGYNYKIRFPMPVGCLTLFDDMRLTEIKQFCKTYLKELD